MLCLLQISSPNIQSHPLKPTPNPHHWLHLQLWLPSNHPTSFTNSNPSAAGHDEWKTVLQLLPSPPTSVINNDVECSMMSGIGCSHDSAGAGAKNPTLLHLYLSTTSGTHTQGFKIPCSFRLRCLGHFSNTTPCNSHCLRSLSGPWKTQHRPKANTPSMHTWVNHTTLL